MAGISGLGAPCTPDPLSTCFLTEAALLSQGHRYDMYPVILLVSKEQFLTTR